MREIEMKSVALDLGKMKRRYQAVFPLSRVGFLFPHPPQPTAIFTGKLELCLRITSESEYAVDTIDGITYKTPFPHVVLKSPNASHTYCIDKPRDAVYLMYESSGEDEMREAGLLDPPCCWQVRLTPEIHGLLIKMRELVDRLMENTVIDKLDLLGMQLFEALLEQRETQSEVPRDLERRIQRVASYFHLNFKEDPDLNDLLKRNGLSRRTFFRYWKIFYDLTPAQYLKDLRLQHARVLLTETASPVREIAAELNFNDSTYFCRAFHRHFGITPLQYRKQAD
jgi:AraC-like DNA-binding protein